MVITYVAVSLAGVRDLTAHNHCCRRNKFFLLELGTMYGKSRSSLCIVSNFPASRFLEDRASTIGNFWITKGTFLQENIPFLISQSNLPALPLHLPMGHL